MITPNELIALDEMMENTKQYRLWLKMEIKKKHRDFLEREQKLFHGWFPLELKEIEEELKEIEKELKEIN
jgi:hypothetical protein